MTFDEKITSFREMVLTDAGTKSEEILKEYETSLQEMLKDHKEAMQRKTASLL
jgi:ElaB/YqjD/DUF883 family membrane-anchored ribosome-binding protein